MTKAIIINVLLLFIGVQMQASSDHSGNMNSSMIASNIITPFDSIFKSSIKISLIMPDTLNQDMLDMPIFIKIENMTLKPLTINDPTDYGNIRLILTKNNLFVPDGIRLRGYIRHSTIQIGAFGVLIIDLTDQRKLDDLFFFGSNPSGEYAIYCIYWYGAKEDGIRGTPYKVVETEPKVFYIK